MSETTLPVAQVAATASTLVSSEQSALGEPPRLYEEARSPIRSLLTRLLLPLLLLTAWSVGSATGLLAENVMASPLEVARTATRLLSSGVLVHHLSLSLGRAALGLLAGAGLGLTLGMVAGLSKVGEELIDPTVQMLRAIPFLALVPLFIVWFGIGETSKVLLIAAAAAKPMYLNAYGGARSVDKRLVEMARVYGMSRYRQIAELFLPAALPSLMVGLRLSTSMSLIALIAVEVINTSRGIGFLMLQAQEFFKTGILVVCMIVYALLGLATDLMVRWLERMFIPWRAARG